MISPLPDSDRASLALQTGRILEMFGLFILLVLVASNGPSKATSADVSGVPEGETSFYHGTLNQTLEVELTLTRKGDTITGSYEYAAHQQALRLQGVLLSDADTRLAVAGNSHPDARHKTGNLREVY